MSKISREEWERKYKRVKCNCGHYMKDHYCGEGWCDKCGCTWYWPNDKYILRMRKKKLEETKKEK